MKNKGRSLSETQTHIYLKYSKIEFYIGLGLGPVHWTQSDDDTCLKIDTCHHLNGPNTVEIFFWLNTRYWDLISYCGVAGCWVLLGILCLENKKVQEF